MKNQTFGIEIETTGIGRERTAKAIAAHFGTTARHIGLHLDDWKVPMPDGRHWTVERDGSVTDPSAEVVSPVCRYEDIEMVQEVAEPSGRRAQRPTVPAASTSTSASASTPRKACGGW